jgi:hypothetical protein
VKKQQAGKGLAGTVVICELWRLAMALILLVVHILMCKWSINPICNPDNILLGRLGRKFAVTKVNNIYVKQTVDLLIY